MKKSFYTFTGICVGLASSGVLLIIGFFLYIILFGLLLFGTETSDFAKQIFYILIVAIPVISIIGGGIIGYKKGKASEQSNLSVNFPKLFIIILLSLLIFGGEIFAWYSYNKTFSEPAVSSFPPLTLEQLSSTSQGKGTYKISASVKELSTKCFCPTDVSCKLCIGEPYLILSDNGVDLKIYFALTSKYSVDKLSEVSEFYVEKQIFNNSVFYYLVGFK